MHIYTYIHTYIHTYLYTYIHIYIHIYIYTCLKTHIRTHRCRLRDDTQDVDAWLRFAEVYLQAGNGTHNKELALHVLSNALDANQSCVPLWLKYLDVFESVESRHEVCYYIETCVE
jgi:hypothetical protein